ncbi:MAG: transcription elongation factor GreA [Candidatus Gracilibacteria bacterium]
MAKQVHHYITAEGLKKLNEELDYLKTVRRSEVSERLKEAISYGDLKENSEYDSAKNDQALTEARIREIEEEIATAEVISKKAKKGGIVELGSTVTVRNIEDNEQLIFSLVGSTEVDPLNSKFSNESPIGEAVLGKEIGTVVNFKAPKGLMKYEILKIA